MRVPFGFEPKLVAISMLVATATLALDLLRPLGVAAGVPYVLIVLVGLWSRERGFIYFLAGLASLLTMVGFFFSTGDKISSMVWENRGLALFAIWAVALASTRRLSELENAYASARESENRYSLAARFGGITVWEMMPEEGRLILNEDFDGKSFQEAANIESNLVQDWLGQVHVDDQKTARRHIQSLVDGTADSFSFEFRVLLDDGSVLWRLGEGYRSGAHGEKPVHIIGTSRDITEAKKSEETLLVSERRLRQAHRITKIGHWEFDAAARKFRTYGEFYKRFGVYEDRAETAFEVMNESIHPDERERIVAAFEGALAGGAGFDENYRVTDADGNILHIHVISEVVRDEAGHIVGLLGTTQDISELRKTDDALRESERRLQGAHRIAKLGHWEFDTATQRFTAYGEKFADLDYGGEKGEFSFEDALRPIHPEDVERVREAFQRSFTEGVPYDETDRVVYDDGQIGHMRLIGEVVRDDAGAIVGMRGTTQDITDLEAANEALRCSEQQLHQAQKMEAVGQLTGGIAHDFNNLLAVILGGLDLALLRARPDRDVAKMLEAGIAATERGAELTERLLSFSRRQTLQPQPTDINELTGHMLDLAKRTLGEAVEVVFEPDEGTWWANVDPAQLENALLNLAINARDSMPDGGTLTVRTQNLFVESEALDAPDAPHAGDYAVVEVEDTGSGMSEEVREKAFEPFFTTKEVGQGSGLGLSMVYGFAKQSGGHIAIDSTVGEGTVIRLSLPRSEETKQEAPEVQPETLEARSSGETVLIVEDHPHVRELTVSLVESLGYTVLEAPDASAALDVMENGAQVDLLLSDVILGKGMNGVELANQVRESCPNTKVLLMSGYAREAFTQEDGLAETYELISKPFRMASLARRIGDLLQGSVPSFGDSRALLAELERLP